MWQRMWGHYPKLGYGDNMQEQLNTVQFIFCVNSTFEVYECEACDDSSFLSWNYRLNHFSDVRLTI